MDDFSKIILDNPSRADALKERAVCYGQTGKFKESMKDLKKALLLSPNDADLKTQLSELEQKDYIANKEKDKPEIKIVYPVRFKIKNPELIKERDFYFQKV